MYTTPIRNFLVLSFTCALWALPLRAQDLPVDARPWQVVKEAVQVIGSPEKDVDRDDFQERLTGEAAAIGAENMRGVWQAYADVYIDTMIILPPRIVSAPAPTVQDKDNQQAKTTPQIVYDTTERAAVYITTYAEGKHRNFYFFCENDSIWRIESWREFPNNQQRQEIVETITDATTTTDTSHQHRFLQSIQLTRLLLTDKELSTLFAEIQPDVNAVAWQLLRSDVWNKLDITNIAFDSIDEYDALDDNLSTFDQFFFRLNHAALERLRDAGVLYFTRPAKYNGALLIEIGRWAEHTLGFAYVAAPEDLPEISRDDFFALKPVANNWWLFKRNGREEYDEQPPLPGSPNRKSKKALLLVPKEKSP